MDETALRVGDVVQINPEHDDIFGGSFMVITELKRWGAQGGVSILSKGGVAYYRCAWEHMELIGHAAWVLEGEDNVCLTT